MTYEILLQYSYTSSPVKYATHVINVTEESKQRDV
jgi:hypothetical protein